LKLTIVFFLLFVSFSPVALGQPYQSIFGKTSTSWDAVVQYIDASGNDSVYVTGDTLIGGYSYKVLQHDGRYYASVREDLFTGKIWIRPSRDTAESLIVDLSLAVGDSFMVKRFDRLWKDTLVTVDAVYFVNNTKYIRFNYYLQQNAEKLMFIEGIGSNAAFFYAQAKANLPYLFYVYKDGIKVYDYSLSRARKR
jgi:hypothetical protein